MLHVCSYHTSILGNGHLLLQGFTGTRSLLTDASDATPISSPLMPALPSSTGNTETQKAICKTSRVQAALKGIKQVKLSTFQLTLVAV